MTIYINVFIKFKFFNTHITYSFKLIKITKTYDSLVLKFNALVTHWVGAYLLLLWIKILWLRIRWDRDSGLMVMDSSRGRDRDWNIEMSVSSRFLRRDVEQYWVGNHATCSRNFGGALKVLRFFSFVVITWVSAFYFS